MKPILARSQSLRQLSDGAHHDILHPRNPTVSMCSGNVVLQAKVQARVTRMVQLDDPNQGIHRAVRVNGCLVGGGTEETADLQQHEPTVRPFLTTLLQPFRTRSRPAPSRDVRVS